MPNNNVAGGLQWKPEHDEHLRLLAQDSTPYRSIAAALNEKFGTAYSKNAVVGRASRIGLAKTAAVRQPNPDRPKRVRAPRPRKPPRKLIETIRIVSANGNSNAMRAFKTVSFEPMALRCVEIEPRNIALMDLEPGECRYPTTDDAPFLFCGHPTQTGSSYCAGHHALCWDSPRIPINRFARVAA